VQSTEAFVAFRKAKGHKQVGFFKVQSTEAFIAKSVPALASKKAKDGAILKPLSVQYKWSGTIVNNGVLIAVQKINH
jgi:hypothetical protein